jgi:NDP-sugar pyrophosphorylase family protein
MQCLILAGGLGVRMRPMTQQIPKAMIEVCGRPFIDHQLTLLAEQGVRRVVLAIGYLGALLTEYVGDGGRYGLAVTYVDEGEDLRGTAGALRRAADAGLLDEGFLVLYGDSYLPIAFEPVWRASRCGQDPLMTILRNNQQWDRSNVLFGDDQPLYYDKRATDPIRARMNYIDYGLSVLTRNVVLERIPSGVVMDLADVFHDLGKEGLLKGYEVHQRFYECGSPEGLRDLEAYLSTKELK